MAGSHGLAETFVMLIDEMKAEPWRFDFYHVLRQLERANADRPRIGDSAARREEYVDLGQDPYLEFPASNLASVDRGRWPAENHRQIPRTAGPAGRAAAGYDRREPGLAVDAGRCVSALPRSDQQPLSAAVLPEPGPTRARSHSTTVRRRTASSPISAR